MLNKAHIFTDNKTKSNTEYRNIYVLCITYQGAEYLVFVSSRSLKTREKYTN